MKGKSVEDEPLWSLRRLYRGWCMWAYYIVQDDCPVMASSWYFMRYHRRHDAEMREQGHNIL